MRLNLLPINTFEENTNDEICVICNEPIVKELLGIDLDTGKKVYWEHGHNAEPLQKGNCCKICNETEVIPARLKKLTA